MRHERTPIAICHEQAAKTFSTFGVAAKMKNFIKHIQRWIIECKDICSPREAQSKIVHQNRPSSGSAATSPSFTAFGIRAEAERLSPGLHVVATPIGNLRDISLRALSTLAAADAILAEDTRTTKVLLSHYGITTPLLAYHEHNAAQMRPQILARLHKGEALALVSDAGTPLVSDPGFKLVADVVAEGLFVTSVPGASAVLAALVVAGLPTDRFFFEGFLPPKSAARRQRIAALAKIPGTLVFFESPRRLAESLADLAAVLGPRDGVVARELTKHFETTRRAKLPDLAAQFASEPPPKGEIVVLVGPPGEETAVDDTAALDEKLSEALKKLSVKDAAAVVSQATGLPRRQVYARAIELHAAAK
jgi:16S rRNA (cytidine1402-2'-O)-methyltransferase